MTHTNRLIPVCALAMSLLFSSAIQAETAKTDLVYVDSVFQWGAWDLDIEPAAGGLQPQTTQPLNPRGNKVTLRTNSISALAPPPPPAPVINNAPVPTPPAAPPVPPAPVTPPAPPVTPPIGGPADGLF